VRKRGKRANSTAAPFFYCGELVFERWEGERPITVWWRLKVPLGGELMGDARAGGAVTAEKNGAGDGDRTHDIQLGNRFRSLVPSIRAEAYRVAQVATDTSNFGPIASPCERVPESLRLDTVVVGEMW
jgi:hypothetical protein